MRRIARPIAVVARSLEPSALKPPLMPRSLRTGPFTTIRIAQPPVLAVAPWSRNGSRSIAVNAATTTGKCIGRQPAITALTASFSALIARWRTGSTPMSWPGGMPTHSRHACTAAGVGGTTGRPSVQPRLWKNSCAAARSSTV